MPLRPVSVRRLAAKARHVPLLIAALHWVVVVRAGLTFSSYASLRRAFLPATPPGGHDLTAARRVSRFVRAAAWVVPGATCLTQALACQILLARRGAATTLHLGVRRADGRLAAHAWLEHDGALLLGGPRAALVDFTPLAAYGAAREP